MHFQGGCRLNVFFSHMVLCYQKRKKIIKKIKNLNLGGKNGLEIVDRYLFPKLALIRSVVSEKTMCARTADDGRPRDNSSSAVQ